MKFQVKNYTILLATIIIFIFCLYEIDLDYDPENTDDINDDIFVLILPFVGLLAFLIGCYVSALIVENRTAKIDKYCGVIFLSIISTIFFISNMTTFEHNKLVQYTSGKKFTKVGALTGLAVVAVLSGFVDNFGLRLGSEAMSNKLSFSFLGFLSKHKEFAQHSKSIEDNLKTINKWAENDWRKVMNHVLRFEGEISKDKKMSDLTDALSKFKGQAIDIPKEILKDRNLTNKYVDNLRKKYELIDDSKGMFGNTFSNFIGSLRGAGLASMLVYITSFDEIDTGDKRLEKTFSARFHKITPLLTGIFVVIGCLIPIMLNVAMKRTESNNTYIWSILSVIVILIIASLFYSYLNTHEMTTKDKAMGVSNTLEELKVRYKINKIYNNKLNEDIDGFIQKLNDIANSVSA